jgi:hypothetical protein
MYKLLLIAYLFSGMNLFAQKLHHQMISTQGVNKKLKNGMLVNQSVGQQSTIGNYVSSKINVGQGYIQTLKMVKTVTALPETVSAIVYPNPFSDVLNFKFSSAIEGNIKINIFDVRGRLIFSQEQKSVENILTLTSLNFAVGTYFVKLEAKDLNYSSQIIKVK